MCMYMYNSKLLAIYLPTPSPPTLPLSIPNPFSPPSLTNRPRIMLLILCLVSGLVCDCILIWALFSTWYPSLQQLSLKTIRPLHIAKLAFPLGLPLGDRKWPANNSQLYERFILTKKKDINDVRARDRMKNSHNFMKHPISIIAKKIPTFC